MLWLRVAANIARAIGEALVDALVGATHERCISLRISLRCRKRSGCKGLKRWSEWQDLNLRPPRPERGVLPAPDSDRHRAGPASRAIDVSSTTILALD
jgi:hypothetical protein